MKKNFNILGIKINSCRKEEVLEKIEKYIKNSKLPGRHRAGKTQKPLIIFTPNPEIVMYAQKNSQFKQIVNSAQINIPDGVGVVWAANTLGLPIRERITGSDLMEKMVFLAEREKIVIGLIGGFSKVALKALECLKVKCPKLKGWAEEGPEIKIKNNKEELFLDYGDWSIDKFIERVKKSEIGILFVGFGYPKQEYFINEIAPKLNNIVLMAVGGSFNYIAGRIPRAPFWIRSLGFEWLWRLYQEPWRIRRQMVLPKFVVEILIQKLLKF